MREKAKTDPLFRERLLNYITSIINECMPENSMSYEDDDFEEQSGGKAFHPFIPVDDPEFDELMQGHLAHIIPSRQMHSRTHLPTCFKYGSKTCRSRFPRAIVEKTVFDVETGVIKVKRNHCWVNNYNNWFSIMTNGNHDIKYLFTKNHALAVIHYVMKYITKPETALHAKLTIAAAVRQASNNPDAKKMLLRIYNKLEGSREVGVPEALSHILEYPDHYTDVIYSNVNTTHLLNYIKRVLKRHATVVDDSPDSEIVAASDGTLSIVSPFDDYAHRGPILNDYCLYDYCSLVYKEKGPRGISFNSKHPQRLSHSQHVRKSYAAVPTLLGKLLFLKKDSDKEEDREDYYCLLSSLLVPWSAENPLAKPQDISWHQFYDTIYPFLSPRIRRYAANLDLLHKTKEETRLDRLQQQAQAGSTDDIDFIDFDDNVDNLMDMNIHQPTDVLPNITAIDNAITSSIDVPD